jgi:multiple sugar transport system substrate-binding protein
MGLCVSRASTVAEDSERLVDHEAGAHCLDQLCELASLMPDEIYGMNPIAVFEQMAEEDSVAYCPFAYTYSNYSRSGFGRNHIRFSSPVALENSMPMRTVLGGTGIAISAGSENVALALEYSLFVAGRTCQRTLYGMCGGQPARRSAWHDPLLNQITDNFFCRTAATIETAYVRPRYRGYVGLQESAGKAIVDYCKRRGNAKQALEQMDALYRASLKGKVQNA